MKIVKSEMLNTGGTRWLLTFDNGAKLKLEQDGDIYEICLNEDFRNVTYKYLEDISKRLSALSFVMKETGEPILYDRSTVGTIHVYLEMDKNIGDKLKNI